MKRIAISQSNYIPWKGYFDLINIVDEFVIYDDVQYTRRDWRNRNKIKTKNGLVWLTIPVEVKGKYFQKVNETFATDLKWLKGHWSSIEQNYSKAPYFSLYRDIFRGFYQSWNNLSLSEINYHLIMLVNKILGINTTIRRSSEFELIEGQTDRILHICRQADAGIYVSGPAAKTYFDQSKATELGIETKWANFSSYPEYRQLSPPFEHRVSILDLIFNEGPNSKSYMKSFDSRGIANFLE